MTSEQSGKKLKVRRPPQPRTLKFGFSKLKKQFSWRGPRGAKAASAPLTSAKPPAAPQTKQGSGTKPTTKTEWLKAAVKTVFSPKVGLAAVLMLASAGVAGGAWLGVQLIVNPQSVLWLNRIVPDWVPLPVTGLKPPQTLLQIREEITKAGRIAGSPLWLNPDGQFTNTRTTKADVIFPLLFKPANCGEDDCEQIVELRLYQAVPDRGDTKKRETQFQLVDQLTITSPDETAVTAPLVEAKAAKPGTARSLPLKALTRFEGTKSLPGIWLNLVGWLVRGDRTIAYGQVVYFNPKQMRMDTLLDWSSPSGEEPQWQEITGGGHPELVVDQTVGLEPKFKIYLARSRQGQPSPVKLDPLTIAVSAIQQPTYINALALARSGLWSPALKQLEFLKQQARTPWPPKAQAQLDLVKRHAKVTQLQADRTWASASQQALVNILDGRWEPALKIFQETPENTQDIAELLRNDAGQIQNRVDATLKLTPGQMAAKTWGALIAAVQKGGKAGAILWLRKQPQTTAADIKKIVAVVSRLSPAQSPDATVAASSGGQVIGTAQLGGQINPEDWITPENSPPLKLENQQTWYRVQVSEVFDGKRWQAPSALDLEAEPDPNVLWSRLGFTTDPFLQVVLWTANGQQQALHVSVKAVRFGGSGLEILAAGDVLPQAVASGQMPRPLAFSDYAVQWFTPSTPTLAEVVQQQPTWAKQTMPILARELKAAKALPPGTASNWEALADLGIGNWSVQLAPITHPTQPDVVLTLYPEMLPQAEDQAGKAGAGQASGGQTSGRSRTLVFSADGRLLYSEFSFDAGQTYLALATLGSNGPLTLVVEGPQNYALLRWSPRDRRFR
jgi:hypothetical protein